MTANNDLLANMMELTEMLQNVVLAAVAGYRLKCEEAGFSPTAAEQMSVELHRVMLTSAFGTKP